MSIKAINQAFKSNLSGNVKLVLLALADCADDNLQCFPSYSHIAKKSSISISTAKRIVKKLEQIGVCQKQHRFKKGKKQQTSNIYTLTFGGSTLTPIKVQNNTTIVSSVTLSNSVTAMTYESSSSLTTTELSEESEREILNFKNGIVRDFQNKAFAAKEAVDLLPRPDLPRQDPEIEYGRDRTAARSDTPTPGTGSPRS